MTDEKEELREKVDELEERVAELEQAISRNSGATSDLLDRYDSYVMENIESVENAHPRELMGLYKQAGIVDSGKRKERAKRLKEIEG